MLSNQLAFLQIGLPAPDVSGQIDSYCRTDGDHYAQRAFKKLNVIAFNDPNDLLSYSITQDFVDRYLDSRMCPAVTNIHINVANPVSAFGIEIVNPIAAHGNYNSDERVIELITHGNRHLEQNQRLSGRCRMTLIENWNLCQSAEPFVTQRKPAIVQGIGPGGPDTGENFRDI
jgi:hypothetical protein